MGIHKNEAFPSASLIKILVLAGLLRQADSGSVSLDEMVPVTDGDLVEDSGMLMKVGKLPAEVSCRRLAEGMIRVSDNAATNLLISRASAWTGSAHSPRSSACAAPPCAVG